MGLPWLALALVAQTEAVTEGPVCPEPFRQWQVRLSGNVGAGTDFSNTYFQLGAGLGLFVANGLEVGIDTSFQFLETPFVFNLNPGVRYIFFQVPVLHPYFGGYYRHGFVDGAEDLNVLGARLGASWVNDRLVWLSGGMVIERSLKCPDTGSCNAVFPEIMLALRF